ncbi:hypothetical protein [Streptomyces sp. URMC 129]|uniref:hypothetical protein n=1 Tax=Streptomyces sp. URMC 129 TaxID=3423407 RepID=UPI003F1B93CC
MTVAHPDHAAQIADLVRLVGGILQEVTDLATNVSDLLPAPARAELSDHVQRIATESVTALNEIAGADRPPAVEEPA